MPETPPKYPQNTRPAPTQLVSSRMSRRPEDDSPRGRSSTPSRGRGNSRSPSPLARQLFGDDMSAEEMEQYNELLDQFGGDEEQLAEAIQQFMEEYEKDPEAFERMMADEEASQGQQARGGSGGRGGSRSPSPGGR